jgi:hypothetical protein
MDGIAKLRRIAAGICSFLKDRSFIFKVVILFFAVCAFLALWRVPKEQVASLRSEGVKAQDVFNAENAARTTLAQIFGGFVVLVGLYFAWVNIIEAKEGQITDRFTKAIDQLGAINQDGKIKLEVRLGGIYALERIARDSERDHWPIMEILTAYVREHAAHVPDKSSYVKLLTKDTHATPKDIQAILTVVGRRLRTYRKGEDQSLDLHKVHLRGADLRDAYLTQEQVNSALYGNKDTKLPSGILMPGNWG